MIRCCLCRATEFLEPTELPGSGFRCQDRDYCRKRARAIINAHTGLAAIMNPTGKRLAVDHDHTLALEHGHDPKVGCIACVRALLCGPCNQTIGRLGVEALCRLIEVLVDPPARKWLRSAS